MVKSTLAFLRAATTPSANTNVIKVICEQLESKFLREIGVINVVAMRLKVFHSEERISLDHPNQRGSEPVLP